jgi:very-short-patch-repair endonuclease
MQSCPFLSTDGDGWKWTCSAQHLADPEAYGRDRRKDALLQQNGYFVLRFLAEDLGKRLDYVLDTVLGALVHRQWCPSSFACD